VSVLPFSKLEPAASAAENHSRTASFFNRLRLHIEFCIFQCLAGRGYRESCRSGDMRPFFGVKKLVSIDAANFSGNLNRKLRGIESRDPANSTPRIPEPIPQLIARVTERCHTAKTADNDPVEAAVAAVIKGHKEIIHRRSNALAFAVAVTIERPNMDIMRMF
jgi:hypothetical protein